MSYVVVDDWLPAAVCAKSKRTQQSRQRPGCGTFVALGSVLAENALDIAESLCALPVVEFQYPAH